MNKKIRPVVGIDIGAKIVACFCLSEQPMPPYVAYYKRNAKDNLRIIDFTKSKDDKSIPLDKAIELFIDLNPSAVVLEPTGVWYSKLWAEIANQLDVPVYWIGHQRLASLRRSYGFSDKDDRTDAFCLAASFYDPNMPGHWLVWKAEISQKLNEISLELHAIKNKKKATINQIRQRLKYEFPEVASRATKGKRADLGSSAWIDYLAGTHSYKRIENERRDSIATKLGIEISQGTRWRANLYSQFQQRDADLMKEIGTILLDPVLEPYVKVLTLMGFGAVMQALLISRIYPFSNFLDSGKERLIRWDDDRGRHVQNKSKGAFQMTLGMGKILVESGGSSRWDWSGSSLCRSQLINWCHQQLLSQPQAKWLALELDRKANLVRHPNDRSPKPQTIDCYRQQWKDFKGSPKDRHMLSVSISTKLAYRVSAILYELLRKEFQQ